MQFIIVFMIITLSYVSSEEADCHLTWIQQTDNPYMKLLYDEESMIVDGIEIRKTLTSKDNITMKIVSHSSGYWEREWIGLCESKTSTKVRNLLNTLEESLSIDITACPVEQQTVKSPGSSSYVCEHEWTDKESNVLLVNYKAYKDEERLLKITFWMVRRGDYAYKK